VPDLIVILDSNFQVVRANKAMADKFNKTPEEMIGHTCYEVVHGFGSVPAFCPFIKLLEDGKEHTSEIHEDNLGGDFVVSVSPLKDDKGELTGVVHVARDITKRKKIENEIKKSLAEKEVLIREIHHRVKNNLQIIASLLNLQECNENQSADVVLKESMGRVKAMATIHEKLYRSPSLSEINFKEFTEKLVYDILYSYGKTMLKTNLVIEDANLNIDTVMPLGLIINELVTNSVKYAFPNSNGIITIKLNSYNDHMKLTIADNGIGLPKDFNIEYIDTLGLELVKNLVKQLDGNLKINTTGGTEFIITFKEVEYKERL
jgi:PAS domain S-box-containing protein